MPAAAVEAIKVVSPVELELVRMFVEGVNLNVVVHGVPRHVFIIESLPPRVEGRSPEVHSQGLRLTHETNCFALVLSQVANLLAINSERDILRSPLHLVCVPCVLRVERLSVIMILKLVVAITIDQVCG